MMLLSHTLTANYVNRVRVSLHGSYQILNHRLTYTKKTKKGYKLTKAPFKTWMTVKLSLIPTHLIRMRSRFSNSVFLRMRQRGTSDGFWTPILISPFTETSARTFLYYSRGYRVKDSDQSSSVIWYLPTYDYTKRCLPSYMLCYKRYI